MIYIGTLTAYWTQPSRHNIYLVVFESGIASRNSSQFLFRPSINVVVQLSLRQPALPKTLIEMFIYLRLVSPR